MDAIGNAFTELNDPQEQRRRFDLAAVAHEVLDTLNPSLKRYTHMRQTGDKYAGWVWLERLGISQPPT